MATSYDGIERLSPSMACAAKTVFATFEIFKKADGTLPSKEVMNQISDKVDLNDVVFLDFSNKNSKSYFNEN